MAQDDIIGQLVVAEHSPTSRRKPEIHARLTKGLVGPAVLTNSQDVFGRSVQVTMVGLQDANQDCQSAHNAGLHETCLGSV